MSQDTDKPLVSVIMSVRNVEDFIEETLKSILQETQIPLEVILIDNGCKDKTVDIVQSIGDSRVKVIQGPGKAIAHALNVAYRAAQGDIFVRCDGDDLYPPGRIARQVEWLDQHPEYGAVCGRFSTIDLKGKLISNLGCGDVEEDITEELKQGKPRTHICTFAVRAEVVRAVGGSREYFESLEDIDFQFRLSEVCKIGYLPDIGYYYRLHNNTVTHTMNSVEREFFDRMALEFQRQRREEGMDDIQRGCPPTPPKSDSTVKMTAEGQIQGHLMGESWVEHRKGNKLKSLALGMRSIAVQPSNLDAWRSFAALLVKSPPKNSNS